MSHFSIINIKLKNANKNLLIEAVKELAKELDAEIVNTIQDAYGRLRSDILIGLRNRTFYRGVGIKVNEKGEVKLVGDFMLVKGEDIERLKKKIVQYYTATAIAHVARQMGMNVAGQKTKQGIYLRCYAI
ncbi:MAG: hypothetical protein ACXQS5_03425 [Candidatus Methanospirareceae archaeon]